MLNVQTDTFLYFAYGSNMSSRRLGHPTRAPSAVLVGSASLSGHRLTFDKVSNDGSGKADCERTGDLTDRVHGGLFQVAGVDLAALDIAEGATGSKPGYRRVDIVVQTPKAPASAVTYLANATHKQHSLLPYPWYLEHVLVGAREFGLPVDYVEGIKRQATKPDLNLARAARELSIYATPLVRREAPGEAEAIHALTAMAFHNAPHANGAEPLIVDGLRDSGALTISLVAELLGTLVGHVAVSPVTISDGSQGWFGLGPISVTPGSQRQGIGSMLMSAALASLRGYGAAGCVLLGDPAFYARFGFQPSRELVLRGVPAEYFQALRLDGDQPHGEVTYHAAFSATS